ncbi:MAG: hypothetical protein SFY66_17130, partial [Oculatellaceae cyanobacterium bins.114]|nr:hypothetical protein [Oculatellaceae cyanobacterium bins.114]
ALRACSCSGCMVLLAELIALILTDTAYIFQYLNLLSIFTHYKGDMLPVFLALQEVARWIEDVADVLLISPIMLPFGYPQS